MLKRFIIQKGSTGDGGTYGFGGNQAVITGICRFKIKMILRDKSGLKMERIGFGF